MSTSVQRHESGVTNVPVELAQESIACPSNNKNSTPFSKSTSKCTAGLGIASGSSISDALNWI
jgi:hypothetical protein